MQGKHVCQFGFSPFGKGLYSKGEDFASLGLWSKLFPFIVGLYTLHSTTVKVPVLGIHYSFLNTQHQAYVYSAVQDRPSTSPAYIVQSITDPVPVLRILYSPLQIVPVLRILYSLLQTQYQSSVLCTVHCRPSADPPYTLQSITDQDPVLRILYNPLETQHQSSVYCTIEYVPVHSVLYSPLQTQYQSPYFAQSTTDPVLVLRIMYSPLQTKYTSSRYSTVQQRSSTCPCYSQLSTIDPVPALHILKLTINPVIVIHVLSPLQIQYQFAIQSTVQDRHSTSLPYIPQPIRNPVPVLRILYSPLQTMF